MIPFQKALRFNLFLWTGWLITATVAFAMQSPGHIPAHVAFAAALWLTFPVLLLGMMWWPICQQLRWKRLPHSVFWISHIVQAMLFSALWMTTGLGSAWWLLPDVSGLPLEWYGIIAWLFPMGIMLYTILAGGYYFLIATAPASQRHTTRENALSDRTAPSADFSDRINPRFVFEMLSFAHDSIAESPGTARQVLTETTRLLRHVLERSPADTVAISRELELIHHYLALVNMRLKDRLQYEENVDPALYHRQIPLMTLQPLLENAIEHGIESEDKGGWIRLNINQQDDNIIAVVENSLGARPGTRNERNMTHRENTALRNLQQRLALFYGENVQFSAQPVPEENIFRVQFQLPAHRPAPTSRNLKRK